MGSPSPVKPPKTCLHCHKLIKGGRVTVRCPNGKIAGGVCVDHTLHEIIFSSRGFTVSLQPAEDE